MCRIVTSDAQNITERGLTTPSMPPFIMSHFSMLAHALLAILIRRRSYKDWDTDFVNEDVSSHIPPCLSAAMYPHAAEIPYPLFVAFVLDI